MKFKLIRNWKSSYKLFSVQMSVIILIWSIVDGILRLDGMPPLPSWFYTVSAVVLIILRNVSQFLETEE